VLMLFKTCEVASVSQAITFSQMPFLVRACRVPVPMLWHEVFRVGLCLIAVKRTEGAGEGFAAVARAVVASILSSHQLLCVQVTSLSHSPVTRVTSPPRPAHEYVML